MKQSAQLIVWRDCTHWGDASMSSDEAAREQLIEMHTIGHTVTETREAIALGMDYIPEQGRYRHISWIPRVNIVKKVKLKYCRNVLDSLHYGMVYILLR